MEYAIELNNVSKKFEKFQLDNVSFQVPKGAIVGFIGENGAGKTTTIKTMLGLLKKDSGEVSLLGEPGAGKNNKNDIGVVFDATNFPESLTRKDIHNVMKKIYGKNWESERFNQLMDKYHIDEKKVVKEMSRGMQMKLSIAIAMSHRAKLLILDEATSSLDPVSRDGVLDMFRDFIQDEEHSILLSSHITSDLEKIADYITFIHEGRIIFSKSKDELIYDYGIIRCTETEYRQMDKEHIISVQKNSFGCELLIDNYQEAGSHKHSYVVDRTNIEEIMLFMIKGEAVC